MLWIRCSQKFRKFLLKNACVGVSFWERLRSSCLQIYQKKTPTQVFSCEIGKIFSSTFITEHLRWEAIVLEIHRKLTCGSSFCNVGLCKTQIYLKSLRRTSSKSQLFKLKAPPMMFSLTCNFLKRGVYSNDFQKRTLWLKPDQIKQQQM